MSIFMKRIFNFILMIILFTSIVSCGKPKVYKPGNYEGQGVGYAGVIKVSVKVDDEGKISSIEVTEHEENPDIAKLTINKMIKKIIDKNDYNVDVMTNATETSKGICEAVKDALSQAE